MRLKWITEELRQQEWAHAKQQLTNEHGLLPAGTKLRRKDSQCKHSFIVIDGKILALAEEGNHLYLRSDHSNSKLADKIKIAEDEEGNLYAIKISNLAKHLLSNPNSPLNESEVSYDLGLTLQACIRDNKHYLAYPYLGTNLDRFLQAHNRPRKNKWSNLLILPFQGNQKRIKINHSSYDCAWDGSTFYVDNGIVFRSMPLEENHEEFSKEIKEAIARHRSSITLYLSGEEIHDLIIACEGITPLQHNRSDAYHLYTLSPNELALEISKGDESSFIDCYVWDGHKLIYVSETHRYIVVPLKNRDVFLEGLNRMSTGDPARTINTTCLPTQTMEAILEKFQRRLSPHLGPEDKIETDLSEDKLLELGIKIALSLHHLHAGTFSKKKIGYLHNDLTLTNIVVENDTPHLIDFGRSEAGSNRVDFSSEARRLLDFIFYNSGDNCGLFLNHLLNRNKGLNQLIRGQRGGNPSALEIAQKLTLLRFKLDIFATYDESFSDSKLEEIIMKLNAQSQFINNMYASFNKLHQFLFRLNESQCNAAFYAFHLESSFKKFLLAYAQNVPVAMRRFLHEFNTHFELLCQNEGGVNQEPRLIESFKRSQLHCETLLPVRGEVVIKEDKEASFSEPQRKQCRNYNYFRSMEEIELGQTLLVRESSNFN